MLMTASDLLSVLHVIDLAMTAGLIILAIYQIVMLDLSFVRRPKFYKLGMVILSGIYYHAYGWSVCPGAIFYLVFIDWRLRRKARGNAPGAAGFVERGRS